MVVMASADFPWLNLEFQGHLPDDLVLAELLVGPHAKADKTIENPREHQ